MTPLQEESAKKAEETLERMVKEVREKNMQGILKYGGGLHLKNSFKQLMAEVKDLNMYAYTADEQILSLVDAVRFVLATYPHDTTAMERLNNSVQPFFNEVE